MRAAVEEAEPNFSSSRTLSNTEYFVARDLPAVSGIDPEGPPQAAPKLTHSRARAQAQSLQHSPASDAPAPTVQQALVAGCCDTFVCVCLRVDDRGLEGRYVHMFSGKSGFEGEIAGMGAYAHEDGTYTVALQAGTV